jgi:hypothetical protein
VDPERRTSETAPDSGLDGVARDATTLIDVIGEFEREGFRGQFLVQTGGALECAVCRAEFDAGDAPAVALRRLEGASDPDDMLAVAALVCPSCSSRGTVVLGYGPVASPEDAAALTALDRPDSGTTP